MKLSPNSAVLSYWFMRQEYEVVAGVEVAMRIPEGRQVKGMRLLRAKQAMAFREEDGYAVGIIPSLHIAEVVHLILER